MIKKKKSSITLFFIFIMLSVIIIVIAALLAPMGAMFNSKMYVAGESLMLQANDTIESIQNDTVKASIQGVLKGGLDNTQNNIEVNTAIYKYGWIVIVGITALVLFLYSRQLVEVGGGLM